MAGITASGLEIKRLPEILQSIETKLKAKYGPTINLSEDSILGQLVANFSTEVADVWEALQEVYDSSYPNSASGVNLDRVAATVGVLRLSAEKTKVLMRLSGNVGTVIPLGTQFSQVGTGIKFETPVLNTLTADSFNIAIIEVTSADPSTLYSVTIGGTTRSYTSGVSTDANTVASGLVAQINTPDFGVTAINNLNGTFTIQLPDIEERTLTISAGLTVTVISRVFEALCLEFGPNPAEPNTVSIISTPVFGLTLATNPVVGVIGRNEETDSELRKRRLESLQIAGSATVDAIRSRIRQVSGVISAIVIENDTDLVDGDGRPPKSFEVVVEGGEDQDIGDVIWLTKPAGIQSFGSESVIVSDVEGNTHTVYFSRPEIVYIHFDVEYTLYNEEIFPASGEDAIKEAMVDFGSTLNVGDDVIIQRFFGPIFNNVPGIGSLNIQAATSLDGITPGAYSSNNITISGTQVPVFATSRISVAEAP